MKKALLSIAGVTFFALMIANVFAQTLPPVRAPIICGTPPPGLTPGFWKHNIQVRLTNAPYDEDLTNGAYSALPDGTKLTDALMDSYLVAIKGYLGPWFTFDLALQYLQLPGWSTDRTNTANWFNWAAGLGYY